MRIKLFCSLFLATFIIPLFAGVAQAAIPIVATDTSNVVQAPTVNPRPSPAATTTPRSIFDPFSTQQPDRDAGEKRDLDIVNIKDRDGIVAFPHGNIFTELMPWVIRTLTILVGGISLVVFVYAGVNYILQGDNPEEVGKSIKMIIYSAIGMAIASLAYSIVSTILKAFA